MAIAPYDAVVVGSGAGGATAAYVLTSKGIRVCLLLEERRMLEKLREYDGLWKINEVTAHL